MLNSNLTAENEPVTKKQRFARLETSELDVLLDSAQSQSTKYNTSFAVSVYRGKLTKNMFITRKCSKCQLNSVKCTGNLNVTGGLRLIASTESELRLSKI